MALYREGKAAMAADGTVTGTGTKWQSSLSMIRPGATIMFLSSPIQMAVVNKVVSDTEIKAITTKGAIVASSDYAILLSDSLTVDGLAQDVAETLRYYQSQETVIADAVEFFKNFDFDSLQNLANQIKADSEAAGASATAAAASESKAKTSETNAKASENAAKTSEVAAETARDQVQQIIDNAGEQSTLAVLAQPDGAEKSGYMLGTVSRKLGEFVSVQDFMTNAEIIDANSPTGTMDHSHAFISAFAESRVVYVPPVLGQYRVANVTVPSYTTMYGYSTVIYNGYEDSHFNGKGSVIRKIPGADRMFIWGTRCDAFGILFDGADRSCSFLGAGGSFRAERCGFYRFERVGNDLGKYCGMMLNLCNINQNIVGLYNLIDSMVANSTINANRNDGVSLGTGANNNSFINTRNEWNLGNNYSAYGSTENSVIGELCDAAGKNGFFAGGGASWNIIGTRVKRSGRQAITAEDNANFRIQDSGSEIILNGVKTYSGVNDGGSGSPSPLVNVYAQGGSTNMRFMATNCDMSGYVNRAMVQSTNISNKRILNCVGMEDLVTDGLRKIANGKSFIDSKSLYITGAATSTISFTQPPTGTYSRTMRRVEIAGRIPSSGETETCILDIVFIREGGISSAVITNIQGFPASRFAQSGTEVSVAIINVSEDASTFELQFTTTGTRNRNYVMYLI